MKEAGRRESHLSYRAMMEELRGRGDGLCVCLDDAWPLWCEAGRCLGSFAAANVVCEAVIVALNLR